MRRAAAAALLVLAASCRPAAEPSYPPLPFETVPPAPAPSTPAPPAPPPPRQDIEVALRAADDAWDVAWTFAVPADGLLFDRRDPAIRHATWTPGPGLRWSLEHGDEVLRPIDGVARARFEVSFATDPDGRRRAAPLNLRWADGGRLLFTGMLGAHALTCAPPPGRCDRRDVGTERIWHFRADDGRGLRALDAHGRGTLAWPEPVGDLRGTYLYAGDQPAIADDRWTRIVDGGLPGWLDAETATRMPALLAAYGERTGQPLAWKPLVLVSRGPGPARIRSVLGRTLPGLIVLEASGAWDRKRRAAQRQWFELVAHEAFHLWNSQVARRADVRDEWWSEGASSFVAGLMAREAGFLDERRYLRRIVRAATGCLRGLRGPLHAEAAEASYYTCGELVHFVVDRRSPGGAWPLYARLFADARTRGSYGTADFLALLEPGLAAELDELLERGLGDDPAARVQALLASAGVKTRIVPARKRRPVGLLLVP